MVLSCLLATNCYVLQENISQKQYAKSFIFQACSVKMAGYWPCSFLHYNRPDAVLVHKQVKRAWSKSSQLDLHATLGQLIPMYDWFLGGGG